MIKEIKIIGFEKEKFAYDNLYNNLVLEDFSILSQENIININSEDYIFNDLNFKNIINILSNKIIQNLVDKQNFNVMNLASGSGKIMLLLNFLYNFKTIVGVENIYEFFLLSKNRFEKAIENNILSHDQFKKMILFNKDPLKINLNNNYKLIIIDYNNTNVLFNSMLQEKLTQESDKNTIIVKLISPFRENENLKLLKTIKLQNNKENYFYVFFYLTK